MSYRHSRLFLTWALVGFTAAAQGGCSGALDEPDSVPNPDSGGMAPGTGGTAGGGAGMSDARSAAGATGSGGAGGAGGGTTGGGTTGGGIAGGGTAGGGTAGGGTAGKGGSGGSAQDGSVDTARGGSGGTLGDASGGAAGRGGIEGGVDVRVAGDGGFGPISCQPAFEVACKPTINFVNDDPAGTVNFTSVITDPVATMKEHACTVCSILYRTPDEIPMNRRHTTINLRLANVSGVAFASGNSITITSGHIGNFTGAAARLEFDGVMVHETVHLYQNYGNGGTGEGMADCVRVRVGLYPPGRCRTGGAWTDAYTTSGCFYSWLTGPGPYHTWAHDNYVLDIPYRINAVLAGTSGQAAYDAVSALLLATYGQNVTTLWAAYQADL